MADYYPLLARALEALPDRTPAMRRAVYERARNALVTQLRSIEPPLSEGDIDVERKALDAAIARLEASYDVPAPANDAASPPPAQPAEPARPPQDSKPPEASKLPQASKPPAPAPLPAEAERIEPEAPEPVSREPRPFEPRDLQTRRPEPAGAPDPAALPEPLQPATKPEPFLPPAPPPHFTAAEPEAPREPAIAIAPPRTASEPAPAEADEPAAPEPAAAAESQARGDLPGVRQRPRIDVVAPRSRSRLLRNAFVGAVLAVVIGLIAVAAYWLRDKPAEIQAGGQTAAEGQASESADAKFADRVGGEPAPAERPTPQPAPEGSGRAAAPAQPDLAVAQRASLAEEAQGGGDAQPVLNQGRVLWRLDSVSGEQGQPLQTAVVATVTIPDAGLTLVMTLQRNLDATLPASHTISLAFSASGPDAAKRSVQEIGLLQPKEDEAGRGAPVAGLPVRVRENLFLIGLSSLRADVERNTDLLLNRNWFDLGLRYASGQRAVITFEKGGAGAQVMQRAFEQWR
ncbi:histidine kinase [Methylobacterium symbioticum]|uniref:Uncharacterized protein n=1 Tax=Methylobacterium symbioticum TaxID=2584084 RepID=A0A509E8I6_9HYPH|nr:histidine kinase [Methylobacterium symbioticum]VUD70586.1 hypothetical protein MET9862_01156 [Methylobacterium symbioticum]